MNKDEDSLRNLLDNIKQINTHIGVPKEEEERQGQKNYLKK